MTTTHRPTARRPAAILSIALLVAIALAGCGQAALADAERPAGPSMEVAAPTPSSVPATGATALPSARPAPNHVQSPPPLVLTPTPAPAPAMPPARDPIPPRRAFAMNLYRPGDYVAQFTNEWCVGASLQMTLNMSTTRTYASRASQRSLWKMAQARSFSPYGGANPRGWTAALNDLGVGPYVLVSIPTFDGALEVAAAAIRETKRPVGLVMWRGRHAWVMSGFESVGDPRIHDDIEVTGVRVLDPLHPNGSAAWGPSPRPNALLKPSTLAKQFIRRDSSNSSVDLGVPPGYLLVLPTT